MSANDPIARIRAAELALCEARQALTEARNDARKTLGSSQRTLYLNSRILEIFLHGLVASGVSFGGGESPPDEEIYASVGLRDADLKLSDGEFVDTVLRPLIASAVERVAEYAGGRPVFFQAPPVPKLPGISGGTNSVDHVAITWFIDYDFMKSMDRLVLHTYVGHAD